MGSYEPLIYSHEREVITANPNRHDYPGNRRIPMSSSSYTTGLAPGQILIRTAGNALQAIPATILEEKTSQQSSQLIEVQVPPNTQPGDTIHVRSPYTELNEEEEEVLIAATIPDGVYPGQTFYVQCPTNTSSNTLELTSVAVLETKKDEERAQFGWW
jgi:hypothetical protein